MLDYKACQLCPRRCNVDRTAGQLGFCHMPATLYAARAAAHYWEEPVISGNFGSGAVFFPAAPWGVFFAKTNPSVTAGRAKR